MNEPSFSSVVALDGVHDFLRIADDPSLRLTTYTVEAWVKLDAPPSSTWYGLLGKSGRAHCVFINEAGFVHHRYHTTKDANAGPPDTANGSIQWDRWHHVAITNDGTTARTYIDGELAAEGAVDGELVADDTTFVLGRHPEREEPSACQLAELRIFSVARSHEDIRETLHHRLTGAEPDLVLCWPLSDGTARDISPHGHHGELVGDPQTQFDPSLPIDAHHLHEGEPVLSFEGGSAKLLGGPLPQITDAVTVETWVLTEVARDRKANLLRAFDAQDKYLLNVHLPWEGKIFWDAGVDLKDRVERTVQPNEYSGAWTHWAFVKDCATGAMTIHRNGALWAQANGKARTMAGITRLAIAAVGGTYSWSGALSEFRIWKSARTPEQIRDAMHHRLRGDESDLVVYWPLDEGELETIHDGSGNEYLGTVENTTWIVSPVPLVERKEDIPTTGLSDYAYWWRWKEQLVETEVDGPTGFRRGRIAR